MSDFINRDDAVKYIENLCDKAGNDDMCFSLGWVARHLKDFPVADVRENVRGAWIYNERYNNFFCSICHGEDYGMPNEDGTVSFKNFCSNCGAAMRGDGKITSPPDDTLGYNPPVGTIGDKWWVNAEKRFPKKSGSYIVWAQFPFEEFPSTYIVNYDSEVGAFGDWHESFDPVSLGSLGSEFETVDVRYWMPLPEPPEEVKR